MLKNVCFWLLYPWETLRGVFFNKIATTFMSFLFMVDKWEMFSFFAMDLYGNPNLRPLSRQATCRHTPKDFTIMAARTVNLTLQPPFVQHTKVSVHCQQYKVFKYRLVRKKFVSYTVFLNFILSCILRLQILQGWLTYYWGTWKNTENSSLERRLLRKMDGSIIQSVFLCLRCWMFGVLSH